MKKINDKNLMIDYLRDESRKAGDADEVLFPESEAEIVEFFRHEADCQVTTQGSRTGVTAGCVPFGGKVISMERMNKVVRFTEAIGSDGEPAKSEKAGCTGEKSKYEQVCTAAAEEDPGSVCTAAAEPDLEPVCTAVVQPGLALQVFREELFKRGLFFTPDPTETSASIGGMIACNSSGARSYRYGAVRKHVCSIRVVLRDGDVLKLTRGKEKAEGRRFCLETESGRKISGELPDIRMPEVSKHTAGYYIKPDMDMIDLFIGSEGTLGIITEAELMLYPAPKHTWGCVVFFDREEQALAFVETVRAEDSGHIPQAEHTHQPQADPKGQIQGEPENMLQSEAIEYFDHDALEMIRQDQQEDKVLQESEPVPEGKCAVYVEHVSEDRSGLQQTYEILKETVAGLGGDPEDTWVAVNIVHFENLKEFRHAAPVCVNHRIAEIRAVYPEITKLGTDMSVPDGKLRQVMSIYRDGLDSGAFRSAVFGHIGNNHLHVNIIPQNMDEYSKGKEMYTRWAREVVKIGGSVSAEHGIGKLKKWLIDEMYSPEQLEQMREIKKLFDPKQLLDRGNIFG